MKAPRWLSILSWVALVLSGLLVAQGTWWSLTRGGNDFKVFYTAWKLVLTGKSAEIYVNSPDRFLYAPGFAWLLAPFAWIPFAGALSIWNLGKAVALGALIRKWAKALDQGLLISWGTVCLGLLMVARPLLIDFQYGQINLILVMAASWALLGRFERHATPSSEGFRWFLLGVLSFAKILAIPLLAVPWVFTQGLSKERIQRERIGSVAGLALVALIPFLFEGISGGMAAYQGWMKALVERGLPLETHNQSFLALLHHYLSGEPTRILTRPFQPILLGGKFLEPSTIQTLGVAWTLITMGFLAAWIFSGPKRSPLIWVAMSIAWVIVPSHLVWKPYFVFSLLIAVLAVHQSLQIYLKTRRMYGLVLCFVVFAMMNLTSFDILGIVGSAFVEGASVLLMAHLALMGMVKWMTYSKS